MFTYRDFEGGTLGLAWTGDLKNAGGVCEKNGVSMSEEYNGPGKHSVRSQKILFYTKLWLVFLREDIIYFELRSLYNFQSNRANTIYSH